jgi:hypothetical protein
MNDDPFADLGAFDALIHLSGNLGVPVPEDLEDEEAVLEWHDDLVEEMDLIQRGVRPDAVITDPVLFAQTLDLLRDVQEDLRKYVRLTVQLNDLRLEAGAAAGERMWNCLEDVRARGTAWREQLAAEAADPTLPEADRLATIDRYLQWSHAMEQLAGQLDPRRRALLLTAWRGEA